MGIAKDLHKKLQVVADVNLGARSNYKLGDVVSSYLEPGQKGVIHAFNYDVKWENSEDGYALQDHEMTLIESVSTEEIEEGDTVQLVVLQAKDATKGIQGVVIKKEPTFTVRWGEGVDRNDVPSYTVSDLYKVQPDEKLSSILDDLNEFSVHIAALSGPDTRSALEQVYKEIGCLLGKKG